MEEARSTTAGSQAVRSRAGYLKRHCGEMKNNVVDLQPDFVSGMSIQQNRHGASLEPWLSSFALFT